MELHQTVGDVAALLRGEVSGPSDRHLARLRSLEAAGPDDLAAVFRKESLKDAEQSEAACLVLGEGMQVAERDGRALVRVKDPELAIDTLAASFGPREQGPDAGVHPAAVIEAGAEVDPSVAVGPWAYVGAGARVGPGTRLWAHSYVGAQAVVGAGCKLYPNSFLGERCVLGDRVVLKPGAVVGSDGFGFRRGPEGQHIKSPQVGIVQVGNDVEVGANSTVDRARLEATVLADGVKLDDQVHVAHNSRLGEHTAMAGHTSVAGGATIGARVLMAGRAAVNGHTDVGDDSVLGACAIVLQDVPSGSYVLGYPAIPHKEWKRQVLSLKRLPAVIANMKSQAEGAQGGS